ncbi:MAG: hypothetical protein IRZ33_00220 [Alicyclobacillaceae bacterium]|nr:hypothetical protein [Alicyclobacillaceae bacterium]
MDLQQLTAVKEWLERTEHRAIVICSGEHQYPNASARTTQVSDDGYLLFTEDLSSRSGILLYNSPHVLILVTDGVEGLKIKGTAAFPDVPGGAGESPSPASPPPVKTQVRVAVEEVFPFRLR